MIYGIHIQQVNINVEEIQFKRNIVDLFFSFFPSPAGTVQHVKVPHLWEWINAISLAWMEEEQMWGCDADGMGPRLRCNPRFTLRLWPPVGSKWLAALRVCLICGLLWAVIHIRRGAVCVLLDGWTWLLGLLSSCWILCLCACPPACTFFACVNECEDNWKSRL